MCRHPELVRKLGSFSLKASSLCRQAPRACERVQVVSVCRLLNMCVLYRHPELVRRVQVDFNLTLQAS